MIKLSQEIIYFFKKPVPVVVSTLDSRGRIHSSIKGVVGIVEEGRVYLIDLYKARTFNNIKNNPVITITALNEHEFVGYALKGRAKIVERDKIKDHLIKKWEEHLVNRISQRVIKNVRRDRSSRHHPEAQFPLPQYLIEMDVEEIVDLTPSHLTAKA